jgi:hypothetical protein
MWPHPPIYVASYSYIFVLILLYMCPHTAIYVSSYSYMCVLILLYMCPHPAKYVGIAYTADESRHLGLDVCASDALKKRGGRHRRGALHAAETRGEWRADGGSGKRARAPHVRDVWPRVGTAAGTHLTCFTGTRGHILTDC